jgi:hypothetical protein
MNFAQTAQGGMRTGKLKIMTVPADQRSNNSSTKQQRIRTTNHDTSYSTAVSPNNRSTTWNSSMLVSGPLAG